MHDAFYNEAKQTMFLVMEKIDGESLRNSKINDKQDQKRIIKQLFESIQYLHEKGICHRDISPNNIIISKDQDGKKKMTLIDFNVSKRF